MFYQSFCENSSCLRMLDCHSEMANGKLTMCLPSPLHGRQEISIKAEISVITDVSDTELFYSGRQIQL